MNRGVLNSVSGGLQSLEIILVRGVVCQLDHHPVAFSNDVVGPLRKRPLSDRQALFLAKVTTLLVGVLAIVFAIKIKSILDLLIYAYHFWAPVIVIPLAAALFGIKARARVFLSGCIAGLAAVALWNTLLKAPGGVDGLIVGVLANGAVFALAKKCDR